MRAWIAWLWYEFNSLITYFACFFGLSLRTEGRKNIPASGSVLIISNHQSFLDPMLIAVANRRHLCFLARKTLFRNRFFGWLIGSLNAVPIDQEGVGKEGLKTILQQLKLGEAVLVFPEGARTSDGNMKPFRPGVNLLINRAHSLIVPIGIAGAYEAWPVWRKYPIPAPIFLPASQRSVAVCVGKPIPSSLYLGMERADILADLFHRVQVLQDRAEHIRRKR